MKIDAEKVVELRQAKFWSQDELAVASGLNQRTIQRIENDGVASLQSKKALASAFDIEVSDLDYKENKIMKYEYKTKQYATTGGTFKELKLDGALEADFNEIGDQGWELVSMNEAQHEGGKTAWFLATFKRPKQ